MTNQRLCRALVMLAVAFHVGTVTAQIYTFNMERIHVDPSTNIRYLVGSGQALLASDLVLTGGPLTAISSEGLSIGDIKLQVLKSTRFCLASGKRGSLTTLKAGDAVLVTSKVGGTAALSVRVGEMMSPMSDNVASGEMRRNYVCS